VASREGWARGLVLQALARAQRLSDVEARVKKDSDTDTAALNALLLAYKVVTLDHRPLGGSDTGSADVLCCCMY
jgi:hypothetical protein